MVQLPVSGGASTWFSRGVVGLTCAAAAFAVAPAGAGARGSRPVPTNVLSGSFSSAVHQVPADANGRGQSDVSDVQVRVSGVLGAFTGYAGGSSGMLPVPGKPAPQVNVSFKRSVSRDTDVQNAGQDGYAPDPSCPWVAHDQQAGEATSASSLLRQLQHPKTGATRYFMIEGDGPRLYAFARDHQHVTYRVFSGDFTLEWLLPMTVHRTADASMPGVSDTPGGAPGPCQRLSGAKDSVASVSVSVPAHISGNGRVVRLGPAQISVLSDDAFTLSTTVGAARLDDTLTAPIVGNATFARPITKACVRGRPENFAGKLRCPA